MIVLVNPNNGRRYKLEPYESGLCFKLYESPLPGAVNKNGEPVKSEWLFTGKYPRDLEDGVGSIVKLMLADPADGTCVSGIDGVAKAIEDMAEKVLANMKAT